MMHSPIDRQSLIQAKDWAFQKMPPGVDGYGRIQALKALQVTIDSKTLALDEEVTLRSAKNELSCSAENFLELLVVGDCVAYKLKNGKISSFWMLTPNTSQQPPMRNQILLEWFGFKSQVRDFFQKRGFYEVQTPTLVKNPGTEPYLHLFSTAERKNQLQEKYFLPTSPEIGLKKLILQDFRNLFEMRPCFRNNENSSHHLSEFWMLEWYRPFSSLVGIELDLKELIKHFAPNAKLQIKTVAQVFEECLGFQLTPQTNYEELKILAESLKLSVARHDSWEDVFHLIFVDKIEPKISSGPLILKNYPPSLSAYSRISEEGWAERFEFYWNGFEIANAFEELTEPTEQKVRFERDLALKKSLGIEAPELDVEFLQMMARGMPPTGGIALGLERFFAAWKGLKTVHF